MYVGRFAPTTSGPLHLGSLLAAVASYLDARAHEGQWLLRLDDIDTPRSSLAAEQIALKTLQVHGLNGDGVVRRQTENRDRYWNAINVLRERGLVFYCTCSRKKLRDAAAYPGYCRHKTAKPSEPASIRVRVPDALIEFDDRNQGHVRSNLAKIDGDFIVMRKESIVSYPLAVVVDDDVAGVTDVVRGADLCENTLAQLYLIRTLGLEEPSYAHIPVLNQRDNIKLSKRDRAVAIDNRFPLLNLTSTLQLLGMNPPAKNRDVRSLLAWAIEHWNFENVPKRRMVTDFMSI